MAKDPREQLLGAIPLFEGLTKKERAAILDRAREERFAANTDIVRAGDGGGRFYVIAEGAGKVVDNGRTIRKVGPGDFFGELSLLDGAPRSATVTATTAVRALSLSRMSFLALLDDNPTITRKILMDMARRLRDSSRSHTH